MDIAKFSLSLSHTHKHTHTHTHINTHTQLKRTNRRKLFIYIKQIQHFNWIFWQYCPNILLGLHTNAASTVWINHILELTYKSPNKIRSRIHMKVRWKEIQRKISLIVIIVKIPTSNKSWMTTDLPLQCTVPLYLPMALAVGVQLAERLLQLFNSTWNKFCTNN